MATGDLYMVRLGLDPAGLARLGKGLPPLEEDLGYRVHMALSGLFGPRTVGPFRILDGRGRRVEVLGYTARTEEELRDETRSFADPAVYNVCRELAAKPMPAAWKAGRRLGFEVRLCPVVRLAREAVMAKKEGEETLPQGAEVDAWLHRRYLGPDEPEAVREDVYRAWLQERLGEAATLCQAGLHAFRRIRLVRRDHSEKRRARVIERPDAIVRGELEVGDGALFRKVLANGVGRHRAFGFGMVLLRRPG